MARITRKQADGMATALNELLGLPTEPYAFDEEAGRAKAQIGCIHICNQNGGNNVYQVDNAAGGCKGLAYGLTMSETYQWLSAAVTGVQLAQRMEVGK